MMTSDDPSQQVARPWSVTLLALGVLSIAGLNLTRMVLALRLWDLLTTWLGVSPLYLALSGLVWGLVGLPLFWGLWRGLRWAPRLAEALALSYALYYWLDHIFLVDHRLSEPAGAASSFLPINWPFAAAVTALLLAYTIWTLGRPVVKAFFGSDEPHPSEDQPGSS